MKIYEKQLRLPKETGDHFISYFADKVNGSLSPHQHPIRFAVTRSDKGFYDIELGVLESEKHSIDSIFSFRKRATENTSTFNVAMLVPTGIGSAIGGHAGDAVPVSRLLASCCDNLITHPNVVNASDINEMSENTLYVEGSVICRLLMGSIGLQKVQSNRMLAIIEKHPGDKLFVNGAINAINAARASAGVNCEEIIILDPAMNLIAEYAPSGRATGKVEGMEHVLSYLEKLNGKYDNIAISSIIKIPDSKLHSDYFKSKGDMVNPWGGVEAIFTHAISSIFNKQAAHSPMIENQLVSNMDVGVVDARQAAEAVSFTYMQCILKGLQRAPKIVTDERAMLYPDIITARDISCLVIPDNCVGLPTLAALEQGITVIAVRDNKNIMQNDLKTLPWAKGQFYMVENYLEAAGVMAALKNGMPVNTLRRPLKNAQIFRQIEELSTKNISSNGPEEGSADIKSTSARGK